VTTERAAGPSNAFVIAHLLGCAATWGSSFLFIKLLSGELSPVAIASLRAVGATLVLSVAVLALGQSLLPTGRERKDWLVLGTVNGWVPNILVAYALLHLDSGPAALIQASAPMLTALLAHVALAGEKLTPSRVVGIVVGLVGVALLIGPKALEGGGTLLGVLAMLLLAVCYAAGNVYARTITAAQPVRLALGQQMISAVVATLLMLLFAPVAVSDVTRQAVPLLALAVLSTALPIWIFMRLITSAGATRSSMTGYLVPTVAVILGVVVLGEPVVLRQIIGGCIVFLGVAIVTGILRLPVARSP
jgi:drug/metabolite transporter (DMT)-like permease